MSSRLVKEREQRVLRIDETRAWDVHAWKRERPRRHDRPVPSDRQTIARGRLDH
ncbi:MAG: hypothetical protein ACE5EC_07010 [Phycisphaerae bacterium]